MIDLDLQEELVRYLALREAFGYPTNQCRPLLEKLVKFLDQNCDGHLIRAQHVLQWACSTNYSTSTQHVRLSTARMFLKHLKVILPDTEVPGLNLIAAVRRPEPFIFSPDQLVALLKAAGNLDSRLSIESLTALTMLGLMASTGLRPGEAIRLKKSHVLLDDESPRLLIFRTKFCKTRWVPLHATTVDHMQLYLSARQELRKANNSDYFFVSKKVKSINRHTLHRIFQQVITEAEIQPRSGQSRPTLQSLRHSFAARRLQHWYEAGEDVRGLLPNLSVYLGHVDPSASYWYLSCTPELMETAAQRFETYALRSQ